MLVYEKPEVFDPPNAVCQHAVVKIPSYPPNLHSNPKGTTSPTERGTKKKAENQVQTLPPHLDPFKLLSSPPSPSPPAAHRLSPNPLMTSTRGRCASRHRVTASNSGPACGSSCRSSMHRAQTRNHSRSAASRGAWSAIQRPSCSAEDEDDEEEEREGWPAVGKLAGRWDCVSSVVVAMLCSTGRGGGGRGGAERGGAAAVEGGAAVLIGVGGGAGFGDGPAAVWVSFAHYVWVEEGKEGGGAYGLVPEHVLLEVVWQCSYSIVQ